MTCLGQHLFVRTALAGVPYDGICIGFDSCSLADGFMCPPTCRIGIVRSGKTIASGYGETFEEALQALKSEILALARREGRVAC